MRQEARGVGEVCGVSQPVLERTIGSEDVVVGIAAVVADPVVVDGIVVARDDPLDIVVQGLDLDVAAARALVADAGGLLLVPDARLVEEVLGDQRADGARNGSRRGCFTWVHNPANFRETLLGLLIEQTGWKFCEFVDDETRVPDNVGWAR